MMMISHKRSSSPAFFLTVCALGLLFIISLIWRDASASIFLRIFAPIVALRDSITSPEVARLNAALSEANARAADRDVLYQENLDLMTRLGRDASVKTILAGVVLRPPAVPYDSYVIDAGSEQGVAIGDQVSAGGTTLIGTVRQVYATTARVVLFSAPGESYDALLMSQNASTTATHGTVPVRVDGGGAGSLSAHVPAGTNVVVGDSIVFPGIVGGFSGIVSQVVAPEGDSFKTIYLHLPVNPFSVLFVEVWKEKNDTKKH